MSLANWNRIIMVFQMSKNHTQRHINVFLLETVQRKQWQKKWRCFPFVSAFIWTFWICDKCYFPKIMYGHSLLLLLLLLCFFPATTSAARISWKYLFRLESLVVTNHLPNSNEYIQTWPLFFSSPSKYQMHRVWEARNREGEKKKRKWNKNSLVTEPLSFMAFEWWKIVLIFLLLLLSSSFKRDLSTSVILHWHFAYYISVTSIHQ